AAAAMRPKGRVLRRWTGIEQPILFDGRHLQVQINVPNLILLRVRQRKCLNDQHRGQVVPGQLSDRPVMREIAESRLVGTKTAQAGAPWNEDTSLAGDVVDDFRMFLRVAIQPATSPVLNPVLGKLVP